MDNSQSETEAPVGIWKKSQSIALAVIAVMLSLGQWNDTKEAVTSAYAGIITHWTNEVEYKQLRKIHIGQTYDYVKSIIGIPQAIKASKHSGLSFYYYGTSKYQLTLAVKHNRVSGFAVVGLQPDFQLEIPFIHKTLLAEPLDQISISAEHFYSDAGNLEYFVESQTLGKNAMFYQLLLGSVNYGHFTSQTSERVKRLNHELDLGQQNELSFALVRQLPPNYFAATELPSVVMIEGLLTHFEYKTLLSK